MAFLSPITVLFTPELMNNAPALPKETDREKETKLIER